MALSTISPCDIDSDALPINSMVHMSISLMDPPDERASDGETRI